MKPNFSNICVTLPYLFAEYGRFFNIWLPCLAIARPCSLNLFHIYDEFLQEVVYMYNSFNSIHLNELNTVPIECKLCSNLSPTYLGKSHKLTCRNHSPYKWALQHQLHEKVDHRHSVCCWGLLFLRKVKNFDRWDQRVVWRPLHRQVNYRSDTVLSLIWRLIIVWLKFRSIAYPKFINYCDTETSNL